MEFESGLRVKNKITCCECFWGLKAGNIISSVSVVKKLAVQSYSFPHHSMHSITPKQDLLHAMEGCGEWETWER